MFEVDEGTISKDAFEYNKARKEKMKTHNCWTCCYFDRCNPTKKCFRERQREKYHKEKNNESL